MAWNGVLVATENFAVQLDGREVVVVRGERFPAGHPVVKGREHLFESAVPAEVEALVKSAARKR